MIREKSLTLEPKGNFLSIQIKKRVHSPSTWLGTGCAEASPLTSGQPTPEQEALWAEQSEGRVLYCEPSGPRLPGAWHLELLTPLGVLVYQDRPHSFQPGIPMGIKQ